MFHKTENKWNRIRNKLLFKYILTNKIKALWNIYLNTLERRHAIFIELYIETAYWKKTMIKHLKILIMFVKRCVKHFSAGYIMSFIWKTLRTLSMYKIWNPWTNIYRPHNFSLYISSEKYCKSCKMLHLNILIHDIWEINNWSLTNGSMLYFINTHTKHQCYKTLFMLIST